MFIDQINSRLDIIERSISERGQALGALTGRLENQIAAEESKLDQAQRVRLGSSESAEERGAVRAVMGKDHSFRLNALRRQLVEQSATDRGGITSVLAEFETELDTTLGLFTSPIQVLSRAGLGDPARSALQAQLAGAGPAELQSTADLARATGNRLLAAAVLVTADRGGKRYEHFDRAAFAEAIIGPETKATRQRLATLKHKIESMRAVDRWFVRGAESPVEKIELGLAQRRLRAAS